MTTGKATGIRCVVQGSEYLPADVGGAEAICAAMTRVADGADAAIVVTVLSPHAAVATATVRGRALPQQRIDVSDRKLSAKSFEMLANAVALQMK